MIAYKGLGFEVLNEEDIDVLTGVMTRAFDEDSSQEEIITFM